MELENIAAAVSESLPTTFVAPLSGAVIPNAKYAPPTQPTAEEIAVTQAQRIGELEAALKAAQVEGRLTPVELPDGSTLTTQTAEKQLAEMSVWAQVESLKSQRFIRELAEQEEALQLSKPISNDPPLLNKDSAEKLMGYDGWRKISNSQKASALDIRARDVDKLDAADYFGPGTSKAASDLHKTNPALYELFRNRAVQKGIIAPRGTAPGPKSTIRAFGL